MTTTITGSSVDNWNTIQDGLGVNQSWSDNGHVANTWYQNTTGRPIMVQIWNQGSPVLYTGPSTSSYATIDHNNNDSDYDTGGFIIVPSGYYWKTNYVYAASNRRGVLK